MAWSFKRGWMWKMLEISCTGNWFEENIEFWVQFASVSERLLVSLFSTIWRNIKWFLSVDTVSKCFVHNWRRVHKNLRPQKFFHLGDFSVWMRLPFSSSSPFMSSKFFYLCSFSELIAPQTPIQQDVDTFWLIYNQKRVMNTFDRWEMAFTLANFL